ncbi:hypothetical protein ACI2L1_27715 [Streptomyces sp. NPDC019531]|uniref:hypothetical protein n=1 Tax=Streptomyces sp. NPDC019531 TaxID=3365062 RepID=UPI00384B8803
MEGPEEHAAAEPEQGHSRERPSPGAYMTPYGPEQEGEPAHRSRPVTAALVAVALVVAIGAGGTLHAVLDDDGPSVAPTVPPVSVSP